MVKLTEDQKKLLGAKNETKNEMRWREVAQA